MPPRKPHKKSKVGCRKCRQRKIKCDEVHPTCGNCVKHGVACDFEGPITLDATTTSLNRHNTADSYSHVSPASTPPTTTTITPFYQNPSSIVGASVNPAVSRQLELKLMHHFTARTSQTFSDTEEQRMAWQVDIPAIAYDAQYLMDAILAVSALHLRSINPDDQSLVRASHRYIASALTQYSSLLNHGLYQFNAEALFSTSALIALQSSASRRFNDDQTDGTYTLPFAWFHTFQGVNTVVMTSLQWLRTSDRLYPIINGQPALTLDRDPDRKLFFAPLLEGLEEYLALLPDVIRADTRQAYEDSVALLNWSHQRPVRSRILAFAATVSRRFVELLGEHDPRALAIAACFFALTRVVDVWWLQGIAKKEVNGILTLLPPDWWPKMEWPVKIANHKGPMDEETWGAPLHEELNMKPKEQ